MELAQAAAWVRSARKIVFFTGAGISAESGIPTFRDRGGLWTKFPPETFSSLAGLSTLLRDEPLRVAAFALAVARPVVSARPNAGHLAIATLEQHAEVTVVTQNIDGLHQLAGSRRVWEIHGTLFELTLSDNSRVQLDRAALGTLLARYPDENVTTEQYTALRSEFSRMVGVPIEQIARPSVVFFGDMLREPDWVEGEWAAKYCDLLVVVGTSGKVFPAAHLPEKAMVRGARVLVVDPVAWEGLQCLKGTAGDILPKLVEAAYG